MTYQEAVRIAARKLDQLKPGWWKPRRFSLKRLNIFDCQDCIAGQIFKKEGQDLYVNCGKAGTGFDYLLTAHRELMVRPYLFSSRFAEEAWRNYIVRRRARAKAKATA